MYANLTVRLVGVELPHDLPEVPAWAVTPHAADSSSVLVMVDLNDGDGEDPVEGPVIRMDLRRIFSISANF